MGFKDNGKLFHVAPTFWADDAKKGWLFTFGAYGGTRVIVLSEPGTSSLADAMETAAEVVAEVAPGIFADPPESEEDEVDMTYTESGWIPSWEWGVNDIRASQPLFKKAQDYAIEHEDD